MALAGQVITSHYAEPLKRTIVHSVALRAAPSPDSETLGDLRPGDQFQMLDNSLGWAWGYAGDEHRVGYVTSDAIGPA
jgi:hypothetical protein